MKEPVFKMTDDIEEQIWNDAIIIFDTSALLNLYYIPKETRHDIFDEVFITLLQDKLWVPHYVLYEFKKNREKVINKPIHKKYEPLNTEILKIIEKNLKNTTTQLNELVNRTKNKDSHPYLTQETIEQFIAENDNYISKFNDFKREININIEKCINEIKSTVNDDDVLELIKNEFKIGRYYNFDEIMKIAKDGEYRFKYSIPPGYMDLESDEKKGIQIFGDLIIWKQIIEFSKQEKKPVIFICDDTKEDWCYKEENKHNRIKSPREELIKEFFDEVNHPFWMYSLPQFLYKSKEIITTKGLATLEKIDFDNIESIINDYSNQHEKLYTCDICDGSNGFDNVVYFNEEFDLVNNKKNYINDQVVYNNCEAGHCEWCNTLHIKCPICGEITALNEDTLTKCDGYCGASYCLHTSNDHHDPYSYYIEIIVD